jgi:type VI secretion system protein
MMRLDLMRSGRVATRTTVSLVLAALVLAGCSTPSWLCVAPPGPNTVTLVAEPDANGNAAIAVDLVFITDTVAAQQIAGLSAQDYFVRRSQLQRDFPAGIRIRSWELAPGQVERDTPVSATCNRVSTLLFARYATPGVHRQVLTSASSIVVSLGSTDFTVSP